MASDRITVTINGRPTTVTPRYARLFLNDTAPAVEVEPDDNRPANNATKTEWSAYALSIDPNADLESRTKDDIIERYG